MHGGYARVVHEDVDPSVLIRDAVHDTADVGTVRYIKTDCGMSCRTGRIRKHGNRFLRTFQIQIRHDDGSAEIGEFDGDRAADPGGAPGDKCDLSFVLKHGYSSLNE